MKRSLLNRVLITILFVMICVSFIVAQTTQRESKQFAFKSKDEFYNYLAKQRGYNPLLHKPSGPFDRKRSILDVGYVEARIRNSATLGYDRDGKCYEFPAGSGITYRWVMAPLVGAIVDGQKWVACGTYGAARAHEDEFEPLGGLDAGWSDSGRNYGIAASDRPDTWPASWPTDPLMPTVGSEGFPGIHDGEVVGTRELYFAVTDSNNNSNDQAYVRIDIWGLQFNEPINEDFIIYKMIVTNISGQSLNDFYIGIHDDPDAPEQGPNEWIDDFGAFIENGTDVDGYSTSEDSLLWNFVYVWDCDDYVEDIFTSNVPWVGLKVLETPEDPINPGEQMGLTTFNVFPYSVAPQTDITEYDQLASGIDQPDNVEPHPNDWTQTPNSYGPDITYVFASGPFDLELDESLSFTVASIHGINKEDLFNNAMQCQNLFNNSYEDTFPTGAQDFWQETNGPNSESIECISINSSDHIFAGTWGDGVFRSTDNGDSWVEINNGITGMFELTVGSLVVNFSDHIFAGTYDGMFRSMDNGDSWIEINTGLTNTSVISLAINSSDHIFAGTWGGGVFFSNDNGDSWTEINTGLTNTIVHSLAINSSDHIFAGTLMSGVFRSTNNGNSWTEINTGLTIMATPIESLVINSDEHIFAGNDAFGVFRSTNNGDLWTEINTGLTDLYIRSLAINSVGHLFVGTRNGGVFRSTNNGDSWAGINTGLTDTDIPSLAVNSSDHIFAGTDGGCVCRSIESTTSVEKIESIQPFSFTLEQNYPNPFNASTTIHFNLPKPCFVTLKIYDLRGRLIDTLIKEQLCEGEYNIAWDAKWLPSGIYLYRMETGDYFETKKLILQK